MTPRASPPRVMSGIIVSLRGSGSKNLGSGFRVAADGERRATFGCQGGSPAVGIDLHR
jgi:hypothetical protein